MANGHTGNVRYCIEGASRRRARPHPEIREPGPCHIAVVHLPKYMDTESGKVAKAPPLKETICQGRRRARLQREALPTES